MTDINTLDFISKEAERALEALEFDLKVLGKTNFYVIECLKEIITYCKEVETKKND